MTSHSLHIIDKCLSKLEQKSSETVENTFNSKNKMDYIETAAKSYKELQYESQNFATTMPHSSWVMTLS